MMILWVLILLDIIVLQFASSMRTEVEITRNFRDSIESYYLAMAGIEMAKFELKYVGSITRTHGPDPNSGAVDFRIGSLDREESPRFGRRVSMGRGRFSYEYHPKDAKYDLNFLTGPGNEAKLKEVLVECGVEPESPELSDISRSIIDWRDADHDLSGPDIGAEDDWYKDNWQGYECKDDMFYSVDELALIRGLRLEEGDTGDEIKEKKALLNRIYEKVDAHPFDNRLIPPHRVPNPIWDPNRDTPIMNKRSEYYEVISTGWVKGGIAQRKIKAGFKIKGSENIQFISWTDNYIPLEDFDPNQGNADSDTI
ncbi:general secretion pathway protein GspK [bacterium]|nr:general secretion pathway protein GspK [bacterium]